MTESAVWDADDSGEFLNPYHVGGSLPTTDQPPEQLIPYRNRDSLAGYYLGIFAAIALVPLLGLPFLLICPLAMWYGHRGLQFSQQFPGVAGHVHSRIAMACGGGFLAVGLLVQTVAVAFTWTVWGNFQAYLQAPIIP